MSLHESRAFAWLQLLRLPNVFTAVADVTMGYLVTKGELEPRCTSACSWLHPACCT